MLLVPLVIKHSILFPHLKDHFSSKSSIDIPFIEDILLLFGWKVAHATDAAGIFACDYLLVPLHHEVGMDMDG